MSAPQWGHVAEWLRSGLQNRLHQFNSGRGLQSNPLIFQPQPYSCSADPACYRIAAICHSGRMIASSCITGYVAVEVKSDPDLARRRDARTNRHI